MSKKKQKKQRYGNLTAGRYTARMITLLGSSIIRTVYDATVLAAEDAQLFSNELRTKALQTAGILMALIVGLVTVICTVQSTLAKIIAAVAAIVLTVTLYGIYLDVIRKKINVTRGNTQSRMLNQQVIDALSRADGKDREAIFLASQLREREKSIEAANANTQIMQSKYERWIKGMILAITAILAIVSLIAILFKTTIPAY